MSNDLQAARSNALQAKADFDRARQNFNAKILSEAEFQKAKSVWDAAQANVSATEERLRETGRISPQAGTRSRRRPSSLRSPES